MLPHRLAVGACLQQQGWVEMRHLTVCRLIMHPGGSRPVEGTQKAQRGRRSGQPQIALLQASLNMRSMSQQLVVFHIQTLYELSARVQNQEEL